MTTSQSSFTWTGFIRGFQAFFIGVFSLIGIGGGFWLAYQGRDSAAGICIGTGVLLFILSNLNQFEAVKAWGLEAKTRRLDAKLGEADDAIKSLRQLSVIMSEISFHMLSRLGRLRGPIPRQENLNLYQRLTSHLREVGARSDEIKQITDPWHRINIFDLLLVGYTKASEQMREILNKADGELHSFPQPIKADDPKWAEINSKRKELYQIQADLQGAIKGDITTGPDRFEAALDRLSRLDPTSAQKLRDDTRADLSAARHYIATSEFKDIQAWIAAGRAEDI